MLHGEDVHCHVLIMVHKDAQHDIFCECTVYTGTENSKLYMVHRTQRIAWLLSYKDEMLQELTLCKQQGMVDHRIGLRVDKTK